MDSQPSGHSQDILYGFDTHGKDDIRKLCQDDEEDDLGTVSRLSTSTLESVAC